MIINRQNEEIAFKMVMKLVHNFYNSTGRSSTMERDELVSFAGEWLAKALKNGKLEQANSWEQFKSYLNSSLLLLLRRELDREKREAFLQQGSQLTPDEIYRRLREGDALFFQRIEKILNENQNRFLRIVYLEGNDHFEAAQKLGVKSPASVRGQCSKIVRVILARQELL